MTKNYYRSEYSDKQWKALIDKATELGCQITYSKNSDKLGYIVKKKFGNLF